MKTQLTQLTPAEWLVLWHLHETIQAIRPDITAEDAESMIWVARNLDPKLIHEVGVLFRS